MSIKKPKIWIDNIESWIRSIIDKLFSWSKSITFFGLGGVPLYDTLQFIYQELSKDNITTRANSVAYSMFIAIFPFLIFLFTLLPYLPISADYIDLMRDFLSNALPAEAADYLMNIIIDLVSVQRTDLQSFSILFTMYFASNGVLTLMNGFDKDQQEYFKDRGFLKMRLVAIQLTLVFSFLFMTSFVLLVLGDTFLKYLQETFALDDIVIQFFNILKYLVSIFLLYSGIAILYQYGPTFKKRLPFFNSGALLATMLSLIISAAFSYYVNNFGQYNELYGSIGALIVVLLWLQLNALAILIGFEFNASIVVNRGIIKHKNNEA